MQVAQAIPPYASPVTSIMMPQPLYPERRGPVPVTGAPVTVPPAVIAAPMVTTAPTVITATPTVIAPAPSPLAIQSIPPAPVMPPVDPAVQAQAQAILAQEQRAPLPVTPTPAAVALQPAPGFIAPAPVLSTAPAIVQAPVITAPQAIIAPAVVPVAPAVAVVPPPSQLSDETKIILGKVPSRLDTTVPQGGKVALDRVSPDIAAVLGKEVKSEEYESVGMSIKVSRPGLDTNHELNNAYNALMGGDSETAIRIYQDIISTEPRNEDALFGLAATYHRQGQLAKARPIYGMLLQVNPNHREGLNNFLALVTDESPQEALAELERLELRNPDFSPIPAQAAIVMDRLGYQQQAREKMLRAIDLAPDNMTYKYNLAIMLDRQGQRADAMALYRLLIDASLRGESVPASLDAMQKRLTFLSTSATASRQTRN